MIGVVRIYLLIEEWQKSAREESRIKRYLRSGRIPWKEGYEEYKRKVLRHILNDQKLLDRFLHGRDLPQHYGFRMDERIIEYPWVLSRLGFANHLLLDAGSALNHQYIFDLPMLRTRSIVVYNLSRENTVRRSNISYIYGDLRQTIFKSECFDEIVCVSTLEHVGMNNTYLYTNDPRYDEFKPNDYQKVIREFRRVLKPGGRLFITVPYGWHEHHGWLQQFDHEKIENMLEVFGDMTSRIAYYKYVSDGWQISDAYECANCSYFDIHNKPDYEPDYVAAARAVACIEMVKKGTGSS